MEMSVKTSEKNNQSDTFLDVVLATAILDQAWDLIRERWQEITPEFVRALFQASDRKQATKATVMFSLDRMTDVEENNKFR